MLRTEFWRRAAASLPPQVRARYGLELQGAERIDLAVQKMIDAYGAGKRALARSLHTQSLKPRVGH